MDKAIITGATGFIGKALTTRLLQEDKTVYAAVNDAYRLDDLRHYSNLIIIDASLQDYPTLPEFIKGDDIDVFYHFAWSGVAGDAFKDYTMQLDNAKYACDALMAAIQLKCKKFIFAGTNNEYEIRKYLKEDYNIQPRYTCIYAASKLAAEMILKTIAYQNGIDYNAGLIAMGYGKGKMQDVLPNVIIRSFIQGKSPKLVEGNNKYDMIHIDDIVEAFLAIAEKGVNQKSYYVGHRNLKTFREIVTEVRDAVNPEIDLVFGEYKDSLDMDYSIVDMDALYNDTGFECKADFKSSIRQTADWLRSVQ